jgi:hypothetical protein
VSPRHHAAQHPPASIPAPRRARLAEPRLQEIEFDGDGPQLLAQSRRRRLTAALEKHERAIEQAQGFAKIRWSHVS